MNDDTPNLDPAPEPANAFERLHPLLQHHIVNGLGWRDLRPFQHVVIPPLLDGQHAIVLAPTAGGKTEAACFPAISRMLDENWTGLSVLYVCPVKALINNLAPRLEKYLGLVGRRVGVWHGDITATVKGKLRADPPDLMLITPESLEVLLVSSKAEPVRFFAHARMVIVDEVHALAGDDRGWHLLSVLNRIDRYAPQPMQRVGLSATVGNPDELMTWLLPPKPGSAGVLGEATPSGTTDVHLDYVGHLDNAATVIARLHTQEKRLVFVDSRARAERLTVDLRRKGVKVWITHSSLSLDQRKEAERAFMEAEHGVIVATSVLELGVDVGDLDRVIQIDSPASVASFLQRMGRTGRRAPFMRNCLFLTTSREALLQAAGLLRLWDSGFVEPVEFRPMPYHVLAQQLMALMLERRGLPIVDAQPMLRSAGVVFNDLGPKAVEDLIRHGLEHDLFSQDGGRLWFGPTGEKEVGRRYFTDLLSLVAADPTFSVMHGREQLGTVPVEALALNEEGPPLLLLAGRNWLIREVDWKRHIIWVEPAKSAGKVRWVGEMRSLSFELVQQMQAVLVSRKEDRWWSDRAKAAMEELRDEAQFITPGTVSVTRKDNGDVTVWTFAGLRANLGMALRLTDLTARAPQVMNTHFTLSASDDQDLEAMQAAMTDPSPAPLPTVLPPTYVKFQKFLTDDMVAATYRARAIGVMPDAVAASAWSVVDAAFTLRV